MKRALGLVLVVTLTGCSGPHAPRPASDQPNPFHHYVEWATVASVERVEENHRIKREEHLCRRGAGMQVCSTEKRIYQPAGVRAQLLRSNATVVNFFDTRESSFLAMAQGQTVCMEVIAGPFGLVVTTVWPSANPNPCQSNPTPMVASGMEK